MLLSNCTVCGSKKSRFIKEQGASDLLLRPNSHFIRICLIATFL